MAREKSSNGQSRLEEAMAMLIQNQAAFLAQVAETNRELVALKKEGNETNRINDERFARIEAILIDMSRMLQGLPEAVREKIGFKMQSP